MAKPSFLSYYLEHLYQEANKIPEEFAGIKIAAATIYATGADTVSTKYLIILSVTNFIRSYLCQFFDDSHGLKASLKPLRRPFDRCQSRLEEINNGQDIKQINW